MRELSKHLTMQKEMNQEEKIELNKISRKSERF